jgi:nucleotide-binding universal stress UspA family protein
MTIDATRIVVGYDGSEPADRAVDWAAAEAERRQVPLTVLHVAEYGVIEGAFGPMPWRPDLVERAALKIVAEGLERARKTATQVAVTGEWTSSAISLELVLASERAALLVVGTRGRGDLRSAALGSVAFSVSAHAHCPVVVVRTTEAHRAGPGRPVVVGVDGSPFSDAAIRFAADAAAAAGAPLVIASAYRAADAQAWSLAGSLAVDADVMESYGRAARSTAEEIVASAADVATRWHPDLKIVWKAVEGPAAEKLAEVADEAGLLVVGSRGRGAFAGLVLGSTSHRVIHTARCPVAVVR